ncbi:MAG: DUF2784 domain-containing protein [Acidobacteriota bacterium]
MNQEIYIILDKFFFVFHSILVLFNLFGWIWKKSRLPHLILISLTAFSWFFLGIWYGYGYCPSTDWHWQVRMKLGYYSMPDSYLQFLFETLTGINVSRTVVDTAALVVLFTAFLLSLTLNLRDRKQKRKQ